jgi:hypothetical protein
MVNKMDREKLVRTYAFVQGEILAKECVLVGLQWSPVGDMTTERLVGFPPTKKPGESEFLKHASVPHLIEGLQQAIKRKNELQQRIDWYKDERKQSTICDAIGMMYPAI